MAVERRPVRLLDDALEQLPALCESLQSSSRQAVFFLDYDGTLSPIVENPEAAFMPPESVHTLQRLSTEYITAIVTGRSRLKIQRMVSLDGIYYAGSHGLDITGPTGSTLHYQVGSTYLPELQKAKAKVVKCIAPFAGAFVEDNFLAFSVHWRLCDPSDVPALEERVDEVLTRFSRLKKGRGKCVFEIRPQLDWNKGKAVEWLLEALRLHSHDILPIYIGDDLTDEDAFTHLHHSGIGVIVGDSSSSERETAARLRLSSPYHVQRFLEFFNQRAAEAKLRAGVRKPDLSDGAEIAAATQSSVNA